MLKRLFGKTPENKVRSSVSTPAEHIFTKIYNSLKFKLLPLGFIEEIPFENFVTFNRGTYKVEWIYDFRDNYLSFLISSKRKRGFIDIETSLTSDISGLEIKIFTALNNWLTENP